MNLLVQLYGIGNLIQTEPLMRYLGKGDILVSNARSTHELAPLFPDWHFIWSDQSLKDLYDDVYLCGPWIQPSSFQKIARRVHTPTWTFRGDWERTEASALEDMAYPIKGDPEPRPRLPLLSSEKHPYIVLSCGYNRTESGWDFKAWNWLNFVQVLDIFHDKGYETYHPGDHHDREVWERVAGKVEHPEMMRVPDGSLMEQVKVVGGSRGYLGNDTGWGHISGAYDLPSAIYTRTDPIKNRTAARILKQFDEKLLPKEVATWLMGEIEEHGTSKEESP
jgi:hypothetical protein